MKTTAVVFALAAVGGLTLGVLRLSGSENPPTWMAVGHGLVAATALLSLVFVAVEYGLPFIGKLALAMFFIAAAGGLFLFVEYQMSNEPLPIPMVVLHGGLAATAFGLLLAALFEREPRRIK
jgi:hypothetical protein